MVIGSVGTARWMTQSSQETFKTINIIDNKLMAVKIVSKLLSIKASLENTKEVTKQTTDQFHAQSVPRTSELFLN